MPREKGESKGIRIELTVSGFFEKYGSTYPLIP
jgi:hypothetical protein